MKTALLTGVTGQDGSYLAELLLEKGYTVHGVVRRSSTFNTDRIDGLYRDPHDPDARLFLHYGDLSDGTSLRRILENVRPDELYNLGAQSHVMVSFQQPEYTADIVATGALRVLECVRDYQAHSNKVIRVYQAGSSEMFGATPPPQSETSRFAPRSPYGVAKVAAFHYSVNYREAFGLFVSNGILFNHESERRGETFVTRKITRAVGRIRHGLQEYVYLGNLNARRDWGFAGDYADAMWRMLQADHSGDFVIATGEAHAVGEFCEAAFAAADLNWRDHVRIDPRYLRPAEVNHLCGDSKRAREQLGWRPQVGFEQLVRRMVDHDLELARKERLLRDAGHDVTERVLVGS